MNLEQFAAEVENFAQLTHSEKIQHFGWYLHTYRGQPHFSAAAIGACYDELHLAKPSAVHPFLNSLVSQRQSKLIRDRSGYRLEKSIRDVLNARYGRRQTAVVASALLESLKGRLPSHAERHFLDETIRCFSCAAYRAAIVMAWNLAYDHFCTYLLSSALTQFNSQLAKVHSRSEPIQIAARGDFEDIREGRVLEIARGAGIISTTMYKILREKLDKRNSAAHPSDIVISSAAAEDVIFDLVENVILKLN